MGVILPFKKPLKQRTVKRSKGPSHCVFEKTITSALFQLDKDVLRRRPPNLEFVSWGEILSVAKASSYIELKVSADHVWSVPQVIAVSSRMDSIMVFTVVNKIGIDEHTALLIVEISDTYHKYETSLDNVVLLIPPIGSKVYVPKL